MKLINYFLLISLLMLGACRVKNREFKVEAPRTERAVKSERDSFKKKMYEETIAKNLSVPLNDSTEKNWSTAFWGIEQVLDTSTSAKLSVKKALKDFKNRSSKFNRMTLETAYGVFPDDFYSEIFNNLKFTKDAKIFAMEVNFLMNNKSNRYNGNYFANLMHKKFPAWQTNPILFILNRYLMKSTVEYLKQRPPLVSLLSHNFGKNCTVIFSLQRNDRDYTGIVIVRKPDGTFVRNPDGTIFYVPQLARAITNLPSYITNGNTPQGIFSLQGVDTSSNIYIGRTTNIQLVMPFEAEPAQFLRKKNADTVWNLHMYAGLLPYSWRGYFPIFESYYAGKAGRTEIIAHGTTVNPDFYKGKTYYPNTPTLGCLSAKEIWSEKDGTRLESDQAALASAYMLSGSMKGYLVVVNLDNKHQPVVIDEVTMDILKAEQEFESESKSGGNGG